MILVAKFGNRLMYGRPSFRKGDLLVADWYSNPEFTGTSHQEGREKSEVREAVAAGVIHEHNMPLLSKQINKQAGKLSLARVEVHVAGEEFRTTKRDGTTRAQRYLHVFLTGQQPVLPGGWKLNAVVDYRQAVPLVSMVPGESMPFDPRTRGATCDHCKTSRARADVFVLKNLAGDGVQVGRQCLGDFLGMNANDLSNAFMLMLSLDKIIKEAGEEPIGGSGSEMLDLHEVLVLSGAIVNVSGWVSRARSESDGTPSTADRINSYINPPSFSDERRRAEHKAWMGEVGAFLQGEHLEAAQAEAKAAIAWAQSNRESEFEKELADVASCPFIGQRYLGRAAYIVPGFRKHQQRLVEAERRRDLWAASQHVGEVGARLPLELELVGVVLLPSNYGTTTLATFNDGKGNQVKWFASNFPEWLIGEKRRVKATVKKYDEYRGVKQTVVVRVADL